MNEGPKKPLPTFGDVMQGRPSGGGQREGRDRGAPERESRGEGESRKQARGGKADRSSGPLVVVKRASGTIETRGPLAPVPEPPFSGVPGGEAPPAAAPETALPRTSPLFEDVPEKESFAEMFEASQKHETHASRRHYRAGDHVTGPIFQLGADMAFVSLGGKSEAMIDLRELKDEEGILRFGVGDTVEAFVIESGAKGIILSRQMPKGAASLARLAEARATGIPIEGLVLSVNKGGLEIAVGEVRAFCPISQIDLKYVENPERFVGEKLLFRVTEVRERNVVLSRRALLEEEQRAKVAETRKELAEGKVLQGKVSSVREFGAFVDLGGVEGMVPVSELSYGRIRHPSEVVKVGDDVEVEVLKIEPAQPNSPDKSKHRERITLSVRSRQEDPWKVAAAELHEGQEVTGKVVRLQPFGAFVELKPGVDGLIHISALSRRRIAHPKDVVSVGDSVKVVIERIDPIEKRVALRRVIEEEAPPPEKPVEKGAPAQAAPRPPKPRTGQVVTGAVDRIEPFGVFVAFPGGHGLIPASETGTERGTDLKRVFKLGQEVKAAIVEIGGGGKLRLSIPAAQRAEERAEMEAWKKSQKPRAGGKGFGTLADLFKEKLGGGQG